MILATAATVVITATVFVSVGKNSGDRRGCSYRRKNVNKNVQNSLSIYIYKLTTKIAKRTKVGEFFERRWACKTTESTRI